MNRLADYYGMIFKRKSFHTYRGIEEESLSAEELGAIRAVYAQLTPLYEDIRTEIMIKPESESSCHRGNEYTIYFYSEVKDNYLQNIGYIGEQLDLWLTERNIGTLWYGIGRPEEKTRNGLSFVIMMGIRKVPEEKFRKDMFKAKRKDLLDMWKCGEYIHVGNVARFAPSACNTQPWLVEGDAEELTVYRYKKQGLRGIIPALLVNHYNRIDMGIFLLFLEVCLGEEEDLQFTRELFTDNGETDAEKTLTAIYRIRGAE